jgi:TonB family protein
VDGERSDDPLTESALEREIEGALAVDPSPEFVARVRAGVAAAPPPAGWRVRWVLSAAATIVVMLIVTFVASRSRPPQTPASVQPSPSANDAGPAHSGATTASPLAPGRRVRADGDIRPPRKIVDVKPIYPEAARAAQARGVVILDVIIATDGSVSDARVVRSSPPFDEAAITAVRQWKFEPPLVNGQRVEVEMNVVVNFTPG